MSQVQVPSYSLRQIENALASLQQMQHATAQVVGQVQTQTVELDNRVQHLSALFAEFIEADRRAKELQLAETRIVKVRQELESEFGHYGDVRRRATGILQALDAGLVTHDSIRTTTEDVMMAAPRYWLAPALVALAAWSRDDRTLAEKALAEALRRDVDKTSLFYALVLRRYGRRAAVALWLGHFFGRQDPTALNREFVVLLDAVATGAFGPEAREQVTAHVREWIGDLTAQAGFLDEQRTRWQTALAALTPQVADEEYPSLAAYATTWQQLRTSLAAVRRNEPVLAHFTQIYDGELPVPRAIEQHVDDLLDSLVKRFDIEELPLRQDEARLQAVIDFAGDLRQAEQRFESTQQALQEEVDVLGLLTNAAMNAEESGASRGTQRLAVAMSRDWIIDAHDRLVAATRSAAPATVDIKLNGWSGALSESVDEPALLADLTGHMDAKTQAAADAVKFEPPAIAAAIGAVLLLIIGIAAAPVMLLFALGAGVYAGYQYHALDGRRARARQAGEEEKKRRVESLRACMVEYVDFREEWRGRDASAEAVRDFLLGIAPEHHTNTREDDARMVIQ